jgi:MEMO1 family protein
MEKRLKLRHLLVCILLFGPWLIPAQALSQESGRDIRLSILAGSWYPASPDVLTQSIEGFLSNANTPRPKGALTALIVPHAGYKYSGPVAAHAYSLIRGAGFRRIILVGPSHRVRFRGVSVNLQSGYETPLGIVPVDRETGLRIIDTGPRINWVRQAHASEHSLEIQLPFLQTVLDEFRIIPIVMGQQDLETCMGLADALVRVLGKSRDTLILASSDLSHFHPYDRAVAIDNRFVERVRQFDPRGLSQDLILGNCEACGGGPVITTLLAAGKLGADRALILKYANSGDTAGDRSRVVGYLAAALFKASDRGPRPE